MSYFRDAHINSCLHLKCPLFLADFNKNWNVSTNVSETPTTKFSKNRSAVREQLLWIDRLTHRYGEVNRLIFAISRCERAKKIIYVRKNSQTNIEVIELEGSV